MPKFDSDRLSKTAAGDHPELCFTLIPAGNGTNPATLSPGGVNPRASRRDGIVSVVELADGTASSATDRTKTANIAAGGSLTPGANTLGQLLVAWYHFEG